MSDYSDESDDSFMDDDELYFKQDKVFSLEELCLRSIVNSFSRYNDVFTNSTNALFHRNLQFLQRVYTHQLLQMFISISPTHGLPKEYLKFFVNDYLREFKLQYFSPDGYPELIELVKDVGHKISTLDLRRGVFDDELSIVNDIISLSPNVEKLYLPANVNDNLLQKIASSCSSLRILDMKNSTVCSDDSVMLILKSIPFLEEFKYKKLPSVILSAHSSDLKNGSLNLVKKYSLLTIKINPVVFLPENELTDTIAVCVELFPQLKSLRTFVLIQKHVDLISAFSNLRNLHIISFDEVNIDSFIKLRGHQLVELTVEHTKLCPCVLMRNCRKLKILKLDSVISKMVENNVFPLAELEELNITISKFEAPYVQVFQLLVGNTPKLSVVHLCGFDFEDNDVHRYFFRICRNENLKEIILERSLGVTKKLVQSFLPDCPKGARLSLMFCKPITSKDISNVWHVNKTINISYLNSTLLDGFEEDDEF